MWTLSSKRKLSSEVERVLATGADVMINHDVPNLTFGAPVNKASRDDGITAPIDVHLMTKLE